MMTKIKEKFQQNELIELNTQEENEYQVKDSFKNLKKIPHIKLSWINFI